MPRGYHGGCMQPSLSCGAPAAATWHAALGAGLCVRPVLVTAPHAAASVRLAAIRGEWQGREACASAAPGGLGAPRGLA